LLIIGFPPQADQVSGVRVDVGRRSGQFASSMNKEISEAGLKMTLLQTDT
jgi:hypothetical protein